jgi:nucleotide-binding universal stress UspA family protein
MKPIARILVPMDFSGSSRRAMSLAARLSLKCGATLTIAHVIPVIGASNYAFPSQVQDFERKALAEASKRLPLEIPEPLRDRLGSQILIRVGDVRDELLRIVEEEHADLIVLGTHGRRYLGRFFLGSTTEGLLRRISVPILTVSDRNADRRSASPFDVPFRRILFATDLSQSASAGLDYCVDFARKLEAHLTVLHVMDLRYAEAQGTADEIRTILQDRFRELVAKERKARSNIEARVVQGVPYHEILKCADDSNADLIVITLRGMGFLERALLGSTAERIVRAAQIPVLSLPVNSRRTPKVSKRAL